MKTDTDTTLPAFPKGPVAVAVSECLIGNAVRYDGGHRRTALPHHRLDGLFTWYPICPEVGIGLGVPRDPIHLVGEPGAPRAVELKAPSRDYTQRLQAYAVDRLPSLDTVHGYIFKDNSPSCGLFDVTVHGDDLAGRGRGIYAAEITRMRPDLPVEESGRLDDAVLRDNFVSRVFVHAHWYQLRAEGMTAAGLIAFHRAYEGLITKHNTASCNYLERLAADLSQAIEETAERYILELLAVLSEPLS